MDIVKVGILRVLDEYVDVSRSPGLQVTSVTTDSAVWLLPDSARVWLSSPELPCAVTPCGSSGSSRPPQEHQEGEAGFAIMFPSMDGVHVTPFHFCKKSISPAALKEAGEARV